MPTHSPSPVPDFLYGTAWKEDRTPALTELALRMGFRGIDTANQRRHYFEAGVGQGLAAAYRARLVTRDDLFLQTKFTYRRGHDPPLPSDPAASLSGHAAQTIAPSLDHRATPAQVGCSIARGCGLLPSTGPSEGGHMQPDLPSGDWTLPPDAVRAIESLPG